MGDFMVALINFFKGLSYKFTNFLIGKTAFFIVFLGWFLIITGLIFLFRPEKARANLVGKGLGTIKWGLSIALVYVALLALSLAGRVSGALSAVISIGTIVGLIWLYFYLTNKSLKILTEKIALVPVHGLRIYAVVQIIIGILMIILHRRIW
jgi:hypothetical protein